MHGDFFETCFEKYLLPEVPEGGVVIYEIATNIFLPPYSPELNLIEHFWHWLKKMTQICLNFFPDLITLFWLLLIQSVLSEAMHMCSAI